MRKALVDMTKHHLTRVLDAWFGLWVSIVILEALENPVHIRQWELAFTAQGIPFPYKLSRKSLAVVAEDQYKTFCAATLSWSLVTGHVRYQYCHAAPAAFGFPERVCSE